MASPCASIVETDDYVADDEEATAAPSSGPKKNGLLDKLFGKK